MQNNFKKVQEMLAQKINEDVSKEKQGFNPREKLNTVKEDIIQKKERIDLEDLSSTQRKQKEGKLVNQIDKLNYVFSDLDKGLFKLNPENLKNQLENLEASVLKSSANIPKNELRTFDIDDEVENSPSKKSQYDPLRDSKKSNVQFNDFQNLPIQQESHKILPAFNMALSPDSLKSNMKQQVHVNTPQLSPKSHQSIYRFDPINKAVNPDNEIKNSEIANNPTLELESASKDLISKQNDLQLNQEFEPFSAIQKSSEQQEMNPLYNESMQEMRDMLEPENNSKLLKQEASGKNSSEIKASNTIDISDPRDSQQEEIRSNQSVNDQLERQQQIIETNQKDSDQEIFQKQPGEDDQEVSQIHPSEDHQQLSQNQSNHEEDQGLFDIDNQGSPYIKQSSKIDSKLNKKMQSERLSSRNDTLQNLMDQNQNDRKYTKPKPLFQLPNKDLLLNHQ